MIAQKILNLLSVEGSIASPPSNLTEANPTEKTLFRRNHSQISHYFENELTNWRTQTHRNVSVQQIHQNVTKFAIGYIQWLADTAVHESIKRNLTPSSLSFSIFSFGSLPEGTMGPFSDLDLFFVIKEDSEPLKTMLGQFNKWANKLGKNTHLPKPCPIFFPHYSGESISDMPAYADTLTGYMNRLKRDPNLLRTMISETHICTVVKGGNCDIGHTDSYSQFIRMKKSILSKVSFEHLIDIFNINPKKFPTETQLLTMPIKIKKQLCRPIIRGINCLFWVHYPKLRGTVNNVWEQLDLLETSGHFKHKFIADLKKTMKITSQIRIRAQLHTGKSESFIAVPGATRFSQSRLPYYPIQNDELLNLISIIPTVNHLIEMNTLTQA